MRLTPAEINAVTHGGPFRFVLVEDPPATTVRRSPYDSSSALLPVAQWGGWVVELLRIVAKDAGLDGSYTLQLPSGASSLSYGQANADVYSSVHSNSTAHAYFARAYVTPTRLANGLMSSPFLYSPLALGTPVRVPSLKTHFLKFAAPFHWTLWLSLLVVAAAALVTFVIVEKVDGDDASDSDEDEDDNPSAIRQTLRQLGDARWRIRRGTFGRYSGPDHINANVYLSGMLFHIATSLFLLLVISAYTAELAVYLSSLRKPGDLATLQSFAQRGAKACVLKDSAYAAFLKQHHQYGQIVQVPGASTSAMVQALALGKCDGLIGVKSSIEFVARGGAQCMSGTAVSGTATDAIHVKVSDEASDGPMQMSIGLKRMPGMEVVERTLSFWITRRVADGTVARLYSAAVLGGGDACGGAGVGENATARLGLIDLSGLFFILFLSALYVWYQHDQHGKLFRCLGRAGRCLSKVSSSSSSSLPSSSLSHRVRATSSMEGPTSTGQAAADSRHNGAGENDGKDGVMHLHETLLECVSDLTHLVRASAELEMDLGTLSRVAEKMGDTHDREEVAAHVRLKRKLSSEAGVSATAVHTARNRARDALLFSSRSRRREIASSSGDDVEEQTSNVSSGAVVPTRAGSSKKTRRIKSKASAKPTYKLEKQQSCR